MTEHPTSQWTAQQIVDAFPNDTAPSYLLRDRDQVYGERFRHRVKGLRIEEVLTTPTVLGRIPSWNGSSARCGAIASTISSSSVSGTYVALSPRISRTITVHGLISRSTRTRQT